VSATDTWCMLVGSCLQCRGVSATWFVNGLSTIGDILRHRRLSLCLAMLHAWILEYQQMMLCVWWWTPTNSESQWPAGEDRRVSLATSGSTRFRRMPTLYCYLRWGDLRSPGVTERRNGSLGVKPKLHLLRSVVDLLYSLLYSKSAANRISGVWA